MCVLTYFRLRGCVGSAVAAGAPHPTPPHHHHHPSCALIIIIVPRIFVSSLFLSSPVVSWASCVPPPPSADASSPHSTSPIPLSPQPSSPALSSCPQHSGSLSSTHAALPPSAHCRHAAPPCVTQAPAVCRVATLSPPARPHPHPPPPACHSLRLPLCLWCVYEAVLARVRVSAVRGRERSEGWKGAGGTKWGGGRLASSLSPSRTAPLRVSPLLVLPGGLARCLCTSSCVCVCWRWFVPVCVHAMVSAKALFLAFFSCARQAEGDSSNHSDDVGK